LAAGAGGNTFGVVEPVRHEPPEEERPASPESEVRTVARGKATRTPFVALASVATVVWLVAGLITAAVLLIWLFV
jgi:hypothetical protein